MATKKKGSGKRSARMATTKKGSGRRSTKAGSKKRGYPRAPGYGPMTRSSRGSPLLAYLPGDHGEDPV